MTAVVAMRDSNWVLTIESAPVRWLLLKSCLPESGSWARISQVDLWSGTVIDTKTRLRVGRAIEKTEEEVRKI